MGFVQVVNDKILVMQSRSQGLLGFQYGGGSGEDPPPPPPNTAEHVIKFVPRGWTNIVCCSNMVNMQIVNLVPKRAQKDSGNEIGK